MMLGHALLPAPENLLDAFTSKCLNWCCRTCTAVCIQCVGVGSQEYHCAMIAKQPLPPASRWLAPFFAHPSFFLVYLLELKRIVWCTLASALHHSQLGDVSKALPLFSCAGYNGTAHIKVQTEIVPSKRLIVFCL